MLVWLRWSLWGEPLGLKEKLVTWSVRVPHLIRGRKKRQLPKSVEGRDLDRSCWLSRCSWHSILHGIQHMLHSFNLCLYTWQQQIANPLDREAIFCFRMPNRMSPANPLDEIKRGNIVNPSFQTPLNLLCFRVDSFPNNAGCWVRDHLSH